MSRLDRLVLLLDTGSTVTVKNTAAKQLGGIQKQHPNDLYNLLSRILVHLKSKTWETRVAAGLAIQSVAENVPQWDPPQPVPGTKQEIPNDEDGLLFTMFNISQVIDKGEHLVASAGKEYDVDLSDMDPKERLAIQKKRLKERLGLGTQFMDVDFFDEQDVSTTPTVKKETSKISLQSKSKEVKTESNEPDPFAGLSARERNQLKRRARLGKNKPAKVQDISSSSALKKRKLDNNEVVVAHKDVTQLGVYSSGDEWPFEGICEQLCIDLFSPQWEIRHGAAIGIRDIVKVHGSGCGKLVGLTREENEKRHQDWLEDIAIRLLCVLALDKFADFVGDQAVIPVRETCAQTLATVIQHASSNLALNVMNEGILKLLSHSKNVNGSWEIRHAALIALKYWMAVRVDLLNQVILPDQGNDSPAFTAIVEGLKDNNDDVRAVAASSLIPVSEKLVELLPPSKVFNTIVLCLWASLQELDDLTAATSYVMDLLADLVKRESIASVMRSEATDFFERLVPQLFPFFRHAIYSVRMAVLRTLSTISDLTFDDKRITFWISTDLVRLVFQNFMLEERRDVIDFSQDLFQKVICLIEAHKDPKLFSKLYKGSLSLLFALIMSSVGTPVDTRLFVQFSSSQKHGAKKSTNETGLNIAPQDKAMVQQDLTIIDHADIIYGRIAGSTALGCLVAGIIDFDLPELKLEETLQAYLVSANAGHRVFSAILVEECATQYLMKNPEISSFLDKLWNLMCHVLNESGGSVTILYQELLPALTALRNETCFLRKRVLELGMQMEDIPPLPSEATGASFTIATAEAVLGISVEDEIAQLSLSRLGTMCQNFKSSQLKWDTQVQMAFASAIVALKKLPPKLNPIIRSLMNSVKSEENEQLQARSANAIAKLILLNSDNPKGISINEKMVKNICVFLCSDPASVGEVKNSTTSGILTLAKIKVAAEKEKPKRQSEKKKNSIVEDMDAGTSSVVDAAAKAEADELQKKAQMVLHRGAEATIMSICKLFGGDLLSTVGNLWSILSASVLEAGEQYSNLSTGKSEVSVTQNLADSLHIIAVITKYIDSSLYTNLELLVKPIIEILKCPLSLIRNLASKALASMGKYMKVKAMKYIIDEVIPMANDSINDYNRQGSVEVIYQIVDLMQEEVLPYLVFLIVPLLGRMSDSNEDVRFLATNVFAQLVKLSPLESGVPNPSEFTPEMIEKKNLERKFIGQLIGSEKVVEFELPVPVKAELRSYQKEGVSWLAFLNRYGLHGILCDDMGLGKTLQSICMMASDHFARSEEYKRTGALDKAHCPCLVVCPSTLTGHWFFEIKKYADFLKPIIYAGDRQERLSIYKKIPNHDVIIISYEVLRNDMEMLQKIHFNYITLDEGHVIKNPNTKLTKAVKSMKGFHRLILSGTPVQNNVLELWSLFDFLMPGFLGTESQFNEKFGKPILASRDAKASSKEQERGALALEALHKQVLPFLMRRMKEDVLDDLPPKIIQDYYCELNEVQKMLYEDFSRSKARDGISSEMDDKKEKKGPSTHIFQALQYLRKLCNHPSFVLTDNHPQFDKVQKLLKSQGRNLADIENAPKLMALQQLLLDCGIGAPQQDSVTVPHRVLIFTQMKSMLDLIETQLFKRLMPSVTYMRLDGALDGMKRHELVQTFNNDPSIDVLLLTTHVGGLGLNLTGADTVIFVEHDWNPMKDLQAMDRAHRIGQKRVVNVYRLITKGTLEEKIMGLQKFKLNIASSIINQDNSGIASMDTNQIMDLFNLGEEAEKKASSSGKQTAKQVLQGLDALWDESQYDEMQNDFLASLK